jgi:hypothetical protein
MPKSRRAITGKTAKISPAAQAVLDRWATLGNTQPERLLKQIEATASMAADTDSTLRSLSITKRSMEILARGREMVGPRPVTIPERLEKCSREILACAKANLPSLVKRQITELKTHYPLTTVARALSELRTKVKASNPSHPSLKLLLSAPKGGIALSAQEVQTLRRRVRITTVMHQARRRPIEDPKKLVHIAQAAIKTNAWAPIAAGLALLTGRRLAEILQAGHFSPCSPRHPHRLRFRGQLKTRKAEGTRTGWYTIDVLGNPLQIVEGLQRLRELLPTKTLSYTALRAKFSEVQDACRALYGSYTPKDLRAAYACIAYHAYAPQEMEPVVYFAKQLGHKRLVDDSPDDDSAADADTLTSAFYLQFYIPSQAKRLKL